MIVLPFVFMILSSVGLVLGVLAFIIIGMAIGLSIMTWVPYVLSYLFTYYSIEWMLTIWPDFTLFVTTWIEMKSVSALGLPILTVSYPYYSLVFPDIHQDGNVYETENWQLQLMTRHAV